ncbi:MULTISPECIES: HAD-IIA family hydrolase [Haloferax]|uniref:HAD-IIA family hydrolase n=1 Tax=Haloferax marinum TaxID=2666143 RepID=A0A6A8GA39_9EURY|nr:MULTISPECIES: HAD-IIA family hydrolase [Haloferax]KAB1197902.1 HAD-IIA family hydrolase [Haloferax sp. CBA1150]MRW96966.1 HAD-IIA family hydrolase [Haloferax marinum]
MFESALLDLDGTVYRSNDLLPGASEGIDALRDAGVRVLFVSNNPTRTRSAYVEKLTNLGIEVTVEDIITSAWVTATYLATEHPEKRAFVVGEDALRDELRRAGVAMTDDPADTDVLVASMDRSFDYETLTAAHDALDDETLFVATNPDRTCPVRDGEIPDAAGMIGAIEGVTGQSLDAVMGKPSSITADAAMHRLDSGTPESCLMVGDRLETDIKTGLDAGMQTALVLTGVTSRHELDSAPYTPDYVFDSLGDVRELV